MLAVANYLLMHCGLSEQENDLKALLLLKCSIPNKLQAN